MVISNAAFGNFASAQNTLATDRLSFCLFAQVSVNPTNLKLLKLLKNFLTRLCQVNKNFNFF